MNTDNKNIKVSIITITYNNCTGLEETIKSVINQDYCNIEYIIIDGGSEDETLNILNKYNDKIQFWISERDNGISDAFNKGIKNSSGDILYFLNSGDKLRELREISDVVDIWSKNSIDILSFKVKVRENLYIPSNKYLDNEMLIWECVDIPHQGAFISKRIFNEIGYYSNQYKIRMDYEFFARCRFNNYKFKYIPKVICDYEPGGKSMHKSNRIRFWKEGMAVKYLYGMDINYKDILKTFLYK